MVELRVARWAALDVVVGPVEALLERYRRYLTVERGLADASAGGEEGTNQSHVDAIPISA